MSTAIKYGETGLAYRSQPYSHWTEQQTQLWRSVRAAHDAWLELEHLSTCGVHIDEAHIDAAWDLYHQVEELAAHHFAQEE